MTNEDRYLGMDRRISRRDFVHGVTAASLSATSLSATGLAAIAAPQSIVASMDGAKAGAKTSALGDYPPARTGLRGNHTGSFEVAHKLGREGQRDWGAVEKPDSDPYDLVVVGAGISGLAAAYFYRRENPDAKVLILDNHDDFGGHAKRNEFTVNGRTLIGYGGAQTLQEPSGYPDVVKRLLRELGVDLDRFYTAFDQDFYKRNGLRAGLYFDKEHWGVERTVPFDMGYFNEYIPVAEPDQPVHVAVRHLPITERAQQQIVKLFTDGRDRLSGMTDAQKEDYLYTHSYRDFVTDKLGLDEPDVVKLLQDFTINSGGGIDAISALSALFYTGMPGWGATGFPPIDPIEPYIHHFPDGNASIARLLVRALIPSVAPMGERAGDVEALLTTPFDYTKLDQDDADARIRLQSTVVNVAHDGDAGKAKETVITYVRGGQAYGVGAKACILACNHSIIPHLCPELPEAQREALSFQEKTPILYTSVALTNWRAWKNLGLGAVLSPGGYHFDVGLDFPVSLGDYKHPDNPDDPIIVHMERFPYVPGEEMPIREQNRIGRYELLLTPYETIERNVRSQLSGMLGAGGFDPARDIAGITVNRWAHGYSYNYSSLFDEIHEDWNDERHPHMRARKRYGRITIANADAAANAMFESAVEEGWRAVDELMSG
ncbi:MAG: NAD(P)-binding protein [Pseudomonadota bacterium]